MIYGILNDLKVALMFSAILIGENIFIILETESTFHLGWKT